MRSYLDHNAASRLRPEARSAMITAWDVCGNPSSAHADGLGARHLLDNARETIASVLHAAPEHVYFTSGGTEAANWLLRPRDRGQRLCLSPVEHACLSSGHRFPCETVTILGLDDSGTINLAGLEDTLALAAVPAVIAVQAANNETGVVQPIAKIAALGRAHGAMLVCDAVQAIGRLPTDTFAEADAYFFSAHKFGGPAGNGAAVIRNGDAIPEALLRGGGQERRQRSGTENCAGAAGMAAALEAAMIDRDALAVRLDGFRDALEAGIRDMAPDAVIFGEGAARLSNTTCFAVPDVRSETMLIAFDLDGVSIGTGAACSSAKVEKSATLTAIGVPDALAECAVRVSTGWNTTQRDIERFLTTLGKICSHRRVLRAA